MVQRKATFRLYPSAVQSERLEDMLRLHQRLYNTALEERIRVWKEEKRSLSFSALCRELTQWRKRSPALSGLNAQSEQVTLKRLALAFDAFFRRLKTGEKPGFPRFKSARRYPGWGYKTHGDGWRVHPGPEGKHGRIHLSGVGDVPMRGQARNLGTPKTCEILHKVGRWYASVTLECEPVRARGEKMGAFDWGVATYLTVATEQGIQEVENPRHLRRQLKALKRLGRTVAKKIRVAKATSGRKKGFPISKRLKASIHQLGRLHAKIARQRKDFLHQTSAALVQEFGALGTEALNVSAMTRKGGRRKRGLNREILSGAPSGLLKMIATKAEEAGSWYEEAPTQALKPSQRCHACGSLPATKKSLSEREHTCGCGAHCGRDENAALVLLHWLKARLTGRESPEAWSGIGPWNSMATASKRETHAIASAWRE